MVAYKWLEGNKTIIHLLFRTQSPHHTISVTITTPAPCTDEFQGQHFKWNRHHCLTTKWSAIARWSKEYMYHIRYLVISAYCSAKTISEHGNTDSYNMFLWFYIKTYFPHKNIITWIFFFEVNRLKFYKGLLAWYVYPVGLTFSYMPPPKYYFI